MILNFQLNTCSNKVSKYLNIKINDAPSILNICARTKSLHHAMSKVSQLNNRTLCQIHHMAIVTKYFTTQWENSGYNCYLTPLLHTNCSIMSLKQAFLFCIYLNSLPINNFLTNGFSSCLQFRFVRSVVSAEPESLWQYDIPNSQIMTYGPSLV